MDKYPPQGVATPVDVQRLNGLCYYGLVAAVPGANQFTIPSLAGQGAGKFAVNGAYYAWVLRDAGGAAAAPQGEIKAITAYDTSTGKFTTAAFSAAVDIGDEILVIHPAQAFALAVSGSPLDDLRARVGWETASLADKLTAARAAKLDLITTSVAKQPTFEHLTIPLTVQYSGDVEPATKTIVVTTEQASPDYTIPLTLPAPSDARVVVNNIVARIAATRDSGSSGQLWCRVYVDVQDGAHRIFNINLMDPSFNPVVGDFNTSSVPAAFALLKDGASHNILVFLFVDSGDCVISSMEFWEGVGRAGTGFGNCIDILHTGFIQISGAMGAIGGGTAELNVYNDSDLNQSRLWRCTGSVLTALGIGGAVPLLLAKTALGIWMVGSQASDLNYVNTLYITLRND